MKNLAFFLLLCILSVASTLYSNSKNDFESLERPFEGDLGIIVIWQGKLEKIDQYYYDAYYDAYGAYFHFITYHEIYVKEMSHLKICFEKFPIIWSERTKAYIYFSDGENRFTYNDGRLSLNGNYSRAIKFNNTKDIVTIENDTLCGPKLQIFISDKKYVLIVQNNDSLATVIFDKSKEIYDLASIEKNIHVSHILFEDTMKKEFNMQWLPGNSGDSSFLALSFWNSTKVLLGVPLCGEVASVNQKCFFEFNSKDEMTEKQDLIQLDKEKNENYKSKSETSEVLKFDVGDKSLSLNETTSLDDNFDVFEKTQKDVQKKFQNEQNLNNSNFTKAQPGDDKSLKINETTSKTDESYSLDEIGVKMQNEDQNKLQNEQNLNNSNFTKGQLGDDKSIKINETTSKTDEFYSLDEIGVKMQNEDRNKLQNEQNLNNSNLTKTKPGDDKSLKINKTSSFAINLKSNKQQSLTDTIEKRSEPESLKILLIIIVSFLFVITILLFSVFIKMKLFKTPAKPVSVPKKKDGLEFRKYTLSDV